MRDFQGVPDRIKRRVPAGANLEALDSSTGMGEPEIEAGALHDSLWLTLIAIHLGNITMTKFFRDFVRDESGAAAAEYALILAIVGAGIAAAAFYLGGAISDSLRGTADEITACQTAADGGDC